MNWLIQKKMFRYFYNKFIPVNRMHYIKYSVYSSLRNSGFCRRSVAPCSTVLAQHTFTRVIYRFTFMWNSSKQGTRRRPTSHLAHVYTVPFIWPREEHRRQWSWVDDFAGQGLLWQLLGRKTFVAAALGLPTNVGVVRSWLFPASSIKFLTRRSLISRWVYLAPHEITVTNCWELFGQENLKIISCSAWRSVRSSKSC